MENKSGVTLVRSVVSLGVLQIINYVFPLISIPIISRIIGPENYGTINYLASFVTYFTLLISYGFDLTATRKITADPKNLKLRSKVFNEVFTAQIYLFVASLLVFIVCLYFVPSLYISKQAAIFTFLICISTVFTQNWLFQAMQELSKVAFLGLLSKVLFTIIVLLAIREKSDYIWQPLIASLSQIIVAVASFVYAYRRYELKFNFVGINDVWRLLKDESTVFFSMVVINLYTTTNVVMLGLLTTNEGVGYYTAALRLIQVASAVVNIPLSQAIFPFVGRAFSISRDEGFKKVQQVIPLVFWITFAVSTSLFIIGPYVLTLFYGVAFSKAIGPFQVMAFVPLVVALNNMFGTQIMLNLKLDKQFFYITSVGGIIGLMLNYILVHKIGYMGAAINRLIVELYITIAMFIYLKRKGMVVIVLKNFRFSEIRSQIQPIVGRIFSKAKGL